MRGTDWTYAEIMIVLSKHLTPEGRQAAAEELRAKSGEQGEPSRDEVPPDVAVTANTYTHVLGDETEVDYGVLLQRRG
jgi:hypothetical protein